MIKRWQWAEMAEWLAEEEVRSACFALGECNGGEGLDWLRIVRTDIATHVGSACAEIEDETADGRIYQ